MKSINKILICIVVLSAFSCTSAMRVKSEFLIPSKDNAVSWSRAHSYLAQFYGYSFLTQNDHVLAIKDSTGEHSIFIIRELGNDKIKFILMITGERDAGPYDDERAKSYLTKKLNKIEHYIITGTVVE